MNGRRYKTWRLWPESNFNEDFKKSPRFIYREKSKKASVMI
jgi:hypothetical protein